MKKLILVLTLLTISASSMVNTTSDVTEITSTDKSIEYWILQTDVRADSEFIAEMASES